MIIWSSSQAILGLVHTSAYFHVPTTPEMLSEVCLIVSERVGLMKTIKLEYELYILYVGLFGSLQASKLHSQSLLKRH